MYRAISRPAAPYKIKISAWIGSYIYSFIWDVVTHPCRNFNGGLPKPPLKLGMGE